MTRSLLLAAFVAVVFAGCNRTAPNPPNPNNDQQAKKQVIANEGLPNVRVDSKPDTDAKKTVPNPDEKKSVSNPLEQKGKQPDADGKKADSGAKDEKEAAPPRGVLTVEVLTAEFVKDRKAAEAKYKDKIIELEGVVETFSSEDSLQLMGLSSSAGGALRYSVLCKINCEDFGKFHWTSSGQKVKIKGVITDVSSSYLSLNRCSFDGMEPSKAQKVTAAAMAKEFESDASAATKKYESYADFVLTGVVEKVLKNDKERLSDVPVMLRTDGKLAFKFIVYLGSEPETIKDGQELTVRAVNSVRLENRTIEASGFLAEKKFDAIAAAKIPKIKTTAKDLASEFVKDGAGTVAKYRRRVIEFDGVIGAITDGTVHLQGVKDRMDQEFTLLCNVNQEDHPKLYWAVPGERVKLKGVFANRFDGFVSFERCSFEPFEKSKILITTPAALAKDFEDGTDAALKKYDSLKGFILSGVIDRITKRTDSTDSENTVFLKTDRKTSVNFVVFNEDIHRSLTKGQTVTVRPDQISYKDSSVRLTGVFVEAKK